MYVFVQNFAEEIVEIDVEIMAGKQLTFYSPLHKYGITPRRSIRRRVFFIWVFRVAKIEKMT
jgi:hypothetical protein